MTWLRSLLFNIFFFSWLLILLLFLWLTLPFPRMAIQRALRVWSRIASWGLRWVGGVKVRFEGFEKLPPGPVLIVSKHQSIWETFIFYVLLDDPQYVLKQELMDLPLWGIYAGKSEHIAVDRTAGAKALKSMAEDAVARLKQGRQVIIFPEGTRTAPGVTLKYHPGVAALYTRLPEGVPTFPAALNSGVHWGRRKFTINPGTITLKLLDPIPPGRDRKQFMVDLENQIETASKALLPPGRL